MKIAFVGSCQVHGMGAVARRLLPDANVVSYHLHVPHSMEEIDSLTRDADYAVTQFADQPLADGSPLPLSGAAFLAHGAAGVVHLPTVVFTGFHPDVVYVMDKDVPIAGAFGQYHSQLTLAGFLNGLDETRTAALFNAHVFAELGYFAAYGIAENRLLRTFVRAGFHLGGTIRRWRAGGSVFMHSHNHPTIALLERLTVAALAKAGLVAADVPPVSGVEDVLGQSIVIPVYTPLARRLGVTGSDTFLKPVRGDAAEEARDVPLESYIERSFAIYRELDPAVLRGSTAEPAIAKVQALLA